MNKSSEGVAAPLEPTQCPSCTGSKDMALCADVFHSPKGVRQTYDSPDGAESSEPNRQEFEKWANHPDRRLHLDWDGERYELYEVELCWQAYRTAAAVSKNLQQTVEQLCGDLKAIQQDYTNEKKRAENLQEELANAKRMLYELTPEDIRGMAYDANALLEARVAELEKEIAALRETK